MATSIQEAMQALSTAHEIEVRREPNGNVMIRCVMQAPVPTPPAQGGGHVDPLIFGMEWTERRRVAAEGGPVMTLDMFDRVLSGLGVKRAEEALLNDLHTAAFEVAAERVRAAGFAFNDRLGHPATRTSLRAAVKAAITWRPMTLSEFKADFGKFVDLYVVEMDKRYMAEKSLNRNGFTIEELAGAWATYLGSVNAQTGESTALPTAWQDSRVRWIDTPDGRILDIEGVQYEGDEGTEMARKLLAKGVR